jgi:hypothetical protein
VTDVGEQSLRLIIEPFLITKEQKNDDHRCTKQVVIEIILKNTELNQSPYEEGHMHSFAWRLTPLSVIGFGSLSASITSASDVQLLFQRLKPWEAFSPAPVCQWIQYRGSGRSEITMSLAVNSCSAR